MSTWVEQQLLDPLCCSECRKEWEDLHDFIKEKENKEIN